MPTIAPTQLHDPQLLHEEVPAALDLTVKEKLRTTPQPQPPTPLPPPPPHSTPIGAGSRQKRPYHRQRSSSASAAKRAALAAAAAAASAAVDGTAADPVVDNLAESLSPGGGRSGGQKSQRQNFTPLQNKLLLAWFCEHSDKPYPSGEDTKELSELTGLNYPQVKKWFANKRMRSKNTGGEAGKPADMSAANSPEQWGEGSQQGELCSINQVENGENGEDMKDIDC